MDCWHRELDRATTEDQIVGNAKDYLHLWAPRELAPLTLGRREVRIDSAADLERWKAWLTQRLSSTLTIERNLAELGQLTDYLWHAADRIGEIRRSHVH
jgi:hypothetical protein